MENENNPLELSEFQKSIIILALSNLVLEIEDFYQNATEEGEDPEVTKFYPQLQDATVELLEKFEANLISNEEDKPTPRPQWK